MGGQLGVGAAMRERADSWGSPLIVSSRRQALERLQAAIDEYRDGLVLLTGEPGSGKTWLSRKLVATLPSGWRSAEVGLGSAVDALDFLRLIGHSLGVHVPERLGAARLLLQSTLQDEAADGRNWLLIVDDAHRGSGEVWDEIHAIRNQMGLETGFAALLMLGRTELARELACRRFTGVATSMRAAIHLMPLDLDEARELLSSAATNEVGVERLIEEVHRDARGNPGRLLRLFDSRRPIPGARTVEDSGREYVAPPFSPGLPSSRVKGPNLRASKAAPAADLSSSIVANGRADSSLLLPSRPPIRLEDGLVEVGWEGDLDSEPTREDDADRPADHPTLRADGGSSNEELIEDRYAALQAWTEWTRNQGRRLGENADDLSGGAQPTTAEFEEPTELEVAAFPDPSTISQASVTAESAAPPAHANLRAEAQHDFAPYSQLFTRLRQSR